MQSLAQNHLLVDGNKRVAFALTAIFLRMNVTVRATGTGLKYQWLKGATALPGQTANTLTIKPLTLNSAGTYKVTVSNIAGSASAQATIAVHGPPVVETGLADTTVNAGMYVRLEVDVKGEGVSFAWFKDGAILPGEIDRFLLKPFELGDAGRYTVKITNPAGSVSSSATVTVIDVAPALAGTYLGLIRDAAGYNFQEYSVTLTGRANNAINWKWNLRFTGGCFLLPPTDEWMGSGTIAAGTPAGTEVRRLKFGIFSVNGSPNPCTFGPLELTGSY